MQVAPLENHIRLLLWEHCNWGLGLQYHSLVLEVSYSLEQGLCCNLGQERGLQEERN